MKNERRTSGLSNNVEDARLLPVHLTQYHPPIRRLQEDFARRLTLRKMLNARGPRREKPKFDMDNSEPWMKKPDSVSDLLEISRRIQESETLWLSRFKTSSTD